MMRAIREVNALSACCATIVLVMMNEEIGIFVLMFGPAILGSGALALGIHLLTKKRQAPRPRWLSICAWLLIAAFFGVGTCYALVLGNIGG